MGIANSGCLGLGPLLTPSSSPKLVQTLRDLKLQVFSVCCGRKHTLALTDFGVSIITNSKLVDAKGKADLNFFKGLRLGFKCLWTVRIGASCARKSLSSSTAHVKWFRSCGCGCRAVS